MLKTVLLRPFRVARAEASRSGGPQLTLLWAPQASTRLNWDERQVEIKRFELCVERRIAMG